MKLQVEQLVGRAAIATSDGQTVYEVIHPELVRGKTIDLDFSGVEIFASPFFNVAVGELLRDVTADQLTTQLHFEHLSEDGREVLQRVIDNSKRYYSDPDFQKALDELLKGQSKDD